jgi:hypothetical protein
MALYEVRDHEPVARRTYEITKTVTGFDDARTIAVVRGSTGGYGYLLNPPIIVNATVGPLSVGATFSVPQYIPSGEKTAVPATNVRSIVVGQLSDEDRRRIADARMDPRHAHLNALLND